jgi:hypothetical protein
LQEGLKALSSIFFPEMNAFVWKAHSPERRFDERSVIHGFMILNANTGEVVTREVIKRIPTGGNPSF